MQRLLDSSVMMRILSDAEPRNYPNLIAANPAWKEDIEKIAQCEQMNAFVSFGRAGERFSFCNAETAKCPEIYKPHWRPQNLQRLNVLSVFAHHPLIQIKCNCDHDRRFPMESWDIRETLQFEKVTLLKVDGPVTLTSNIRAECKALIVRRSNLSHPSWTPFLARILKSRKLGTLAVHADSKLSKEIKNEIVDLLVIGNLREVWLPALENPFSDFRSEVLTELDLVRYVFATLFNWNRRTDPEIKFATFYCVYLLDKTMRTLGMKSFGRKDRFVIDHPIVKGKRANFHIGPRADMFYCELTISFEDDSCK